jgi:hypothetical protein
MIYKTLIKKLYIIPLFLILINLYNFFLPTDYRNDPYLINGYFSKENQKILNYISEDNRTEILKYEDAIKRLDQLYYNYGESLRFLNEATKIYFISKAPAKYSWKKKYTKIKFQENWILFFVRKFEEFQLSFSQKSKYGGAYISYHSSDYKFALKRGVSLCSQDAVSFANLLKRKYKIDYNIVSLGGHVLMEAKIHNRYYLSDPNLGISFNFNIDEYYNDRRNQLMIKKAYTGVGRPDLIKYFDVENNRKFTYTGPKSNKNTYNPDTLTFYSNYIKWLLPIFLLLIGFYLKYKIPQSKF